MRTRSHSYLNMKARHGYLLINCCRDFFIGCCVFLLASLTVYAEEFDIETDQERLKMLSSFLSNLEGKHPQLKHAQSKVAAAEARSRAADQPLYNPELEFDAERVGLHGANSDALTLGINQALDWHDKRAARTTVANSEQRINHYEQLIHRQDLIVEIFLALTSYQTQTFKTIAHENRLKLMEKVMLQAELLYGVGDISKLEFEQLRLSQSQAQLLGDQAATQLSIDRMQLVTVTGTDQANWPPLPTELPKFEYKQIVYKNILSQHPAYQFNLAKVEAADNTRRLRRLEKKADPTIGFRVGDEASDTLVGLTLSIPLNVRNTYQAEVDEAQANFNASQFLNEGEAHQLETRLKAAAKTYQLTYSSWQSWHQATGRSLQDQSQLLLRLWKSGELSTSDYLLQLDQIKDVEMNNVELTGNVWESWFNWLFVSNQFDDWLNGSYPNQDADLINDLSTEKLRDEK